MLTLQYCMKQLPAEFATQKRKERVTVFCNCFWTTGLAVAPGPVDATNGLVDATNGPVDGPMSVVWAMPLHLPQHWATSVFQMEDILTVYVQDSLTGTSAVELGRDLITNILEDTSTCLPDDIDFPAAAVCAM